MTEEEASGREKTGEEEEEGTEERRKREGKLETEKGNNKEVW